MNFAIVGCGRISRKHCEALTCHVPGARLVSVCDVDPARARAVGDAYGVPFYPGHREMLEKHPEIQVVNVLTPSGGHARNVIELAPWGKHIVVEKPMALTMADAEAMLRACDQAGVRLFVVKQNRMNPPIRLLRKAVQAGWFGKMVMATVRVRWCRTQSYYDQDSWRGTWAGDGGVLMNQASHHIDLLTWLMGDVETVFARAATRLVKIQTEDTAVAVLRFQSGALGLIEATTAARPKDLEGSISILGETGTVVVGGFAVNEMVTWNFSHPEALSAEEALKASEFPPDVYGFGHVEYLRKVVDTISTGRLSAVDGIEGMKSLLVINGLYESIETGREVQLLFRPHHLKFELENRVGQRHVSGP